MTYVQKVSERCDEMLKASLLEKKAQLEELERRRIHHTRSWLPEQLDKRVKRDFMEKATDLRLLPLFITYFAVIEDHMKSSYFAVLSAWAEQNGLNIRYKDLGEFPSLNGDHSKIKFVVLIDEKASALNHTPSETVFSDDIITLRNITRAYKTALRNRTTQDEAKKLAKIIEDRSKIYVEQEAQEYLSGAMEKIDAMCSDKEELKYKSVFSTKSSIMLSSSMSERIFEALRLLCDKEGIEFSYESNGNIGLNYTNRLVSRDDCQWELVFRLTLLTEQSKEYQNVRK